MKKNSETPSKVNAPVDDERVKNIAKKFVQLRKEAGFTNYEEFAWEHNIKRAQYWRMEKGTNFTIVSLLKILDAHKISMEDFFKGL